MRTREKTKIQKKSKKEIAQSVKSEGKAKNKENQKKTKELETKQQNLETQQKELEKNLKLLGDKLIDNKEEKQSIENKIKEYMIEIGIDPKYYLLTDHSMKSPYDYYGHKKNCLPDCIELLMRDGSVQEISEVSTIIKGINLFYGFQKSVLQQILCQMSI